MRGTSTDHDYREEIEQDLVAAAGTNTHHLLYGPPGTGKTTIAMRASMPGQKVTEVTFRGGAGDYAFFGQMLPDTDEQGKFCGMSWVPGPIYTAIREGHKLVINEINHISDDLSHRMHFIGDSWKVAQDTLPNGEVITISPQFWMVATMNGIPEELPEAVRDRFKVCINVPTPSEAMYARLDPDVREICMEKYTKADPIVGPDVTYRNCLAFTELRRVYGDDAKTAKRVFGDKDKAVAFTEALVMIKTRIQQELDTKVTRLVDAFTQISTNSALRAAPGHLGTAMQILVKAVVKSEYERLLVDMDGKF